LKKVVNSVMANKKIIRAAATKGDRDGRSEGEREGASWAIDKFNGVTHVKLGKSLKVSNCLAQINIKTTRKMAKTRLANEHNKILGGTNGYTNIYI